MKLLKIRVSGLELFKETLEVDFFAEQRVYPDNNEMLSHVFGSTYTNNILSYIGINASGKTSILKVISFVISMLNSEPINNIDSKRILDGSKCVEIESYFYHKKCGICKLYTVLEKKHDYLDEERFYIAQEMLWVKKESKVTTKKSLFEFDSLYSVRNNKEEYLKDDISIIISLNKNTNFYVRDLTSLTNINLLRILGKFPYELVKFLDANIEYLFYDVEKDKVKLKFYNKNEILLANPGEVNDYLSSGTIKGLNVFVHAQLAFQEGGYLIIDEIENHFNQEVVSTLIRFFNNKKVNKNGATLIFSTHYSELLDEFERNDCVNIVRNRGGITSEKLSRILKRNDIKKSEAYQSDFLQGTVPAYEAYMDLKNKMIRSWVEEV